METAGKKTAKKVEAVLEHISLLIMTLTVTKVGLNKPST